jgi:hypothetical protein
MKRETHRERDLFRCLIIMRAHSVSVVQLPFIQGPNLHALNAWVHGRPLARQGAREFWINISEDCQGDYKEGRGGTSTKSP